MSRIRSLHPGQWSEESFVACSPWARLLLLGLRNVADDRGVFEWRPRSIKMFVFPGDPVDCMALLDELMRHGEIDRFEANGRCYGVCRSWDQRPKKPTFRFPAPPAAVADQSNIGTEPVPERFGTGAESVPAPTRAWRELESESGIVEREPAAMDAAAGAPDGAALSLKNLNLPEDWLAAAAEERRKAGLPAVNLKLEWANLRVKKGHLRSTRDDWRRRWLGWALAARVDLAPAGPDKAAAELGQPAPTRPARPHALGGAGERLKGVIGEAAFGALFASVELVALKDGVLTLWAPTGFVRQQLQQRDLEVLHAFAPDGARRLEVVLKRPASPAAAAAARKRGRAKPADRREPELLLPLAGRGGVSANEAGALRTKRERGAA